MFVTVLGYSHQFGFNAVNKASFTFRLHGNCYDFTMNPNFTW